MRGYIFAIGIAFGLLGWNPPVQAQVDVIGTGLQGYDGYYGGYHASTFPEGVQRGFADVIRSAGQYNLLTGQAAIAWEEAWRLDAENRFRIVQGYFEARRINREYQQEVNRMPDEEAVLRYLETLRPKRLTWDDLGVSGDLRWPPHLAAAKFDLYRTRLERLFNERAYKGALSAAEQAQVDELVRTMIMELRLDIEAMRPAYYVKTKQFLVSVNYEAGLPVQ